MSDTRKYYKRDNRKAFFNLKWDEQNGCCAICKQKARLVIDHDHSSGLMRGLLCYTHNTALGLFNDSPELLQSAIDYIQTHKPVKLVESRTLTTKYERYLAGKPLLQKLLANPAFPSDRARARTLSKALGINYNTACTHVRRERARLKKLDKN